MKRWRKCLDAQKMHNNSFQKSNMVLYHLIRPQISYRAECGGGAVSKCLSCYPATGDPCNLNILLNSNNFPNYFQGDLIRRHHRDRVELQP